MLEQQNSISLIFLQNCLKSVKQPDVEQIRNKKSQLQYLYKNQKDQQLWIHILIKLKRFDYNFIFNLKAETSSCSSTSTYMVQSIYHKFFKTNVITKVFLKMKFQNGALKQEKASWGIVQNLLSKFFKIF
ncbi:unnamed protein product [Paramecium sonneborni]|uniref:Uncharacterized protein n=1 Tax=Paramecium sonneborni TaxID=65129 RepID=A0A8S1RR00_9CILI|nr:unnamed protein product [Paramecium sonneborni]